MATGLFSFKGIKNLGLRIVSWAKKITLPFFDGVPLYDVSLFFWKSIAQGSISNRASGIAFNFFLALFPSLIFLFTLIPILPIPNFQNNLFMMIKEIVPASIFGTIESTILDILKNPRGGLLSLGFFMALIFSTNGFTAMMSAFDATIHSYESRTWLGQKVVSILLVMIMAVLLTTTIALLAGGQYLLDALKDNHILEDRFIYYLLTVGRWIIIIALFFFAYAFLYYMAPAKKTKWRFISAGGSLATLLSIFTFVGFGFYINHFSQYNKLYGSIGTLLIVLLLIYFISLILLIGFELNASIQEAHTNKK
jgi:membrane protein